MASSPQFSFGVRRDHRAVVVDVHGTLDLAASAGLGAVLGDLIEGQGNLNVSVDLRETDAVDPAGLGVIAVAASLARPLGGELQVVGTAPADPSVPAETPAHGHLVAFYDDDRSLAVSVRDHLAPALQGADAAVVVATEAHRAAFEAALAKAGIDVAEARAAGRYVDLDATETLSRFMDGDVPHPRRFVTVVGGLLRRLTGSGRAVRVYGEMVAVLWADGNVAGALALEDLWNRLGRAQPFSLLCAYPVDAFGGPGTEGAFRAVCQHHEGAIQPVSSTDRMRR
jgi:anti-anti-sigma regulatory factor